MKRKNILLALGVVLLTVCTSVITTSLVGRKTGKGGTSAAEETSRPTSFASMSTVEAMPTDFTVAAEKSVESVVHVKVKMKIEQGYTGIDPFFEFFFGRPSQPIEPQEQMSSGSGVIISDDGYIVTNNHVVEDASTVEVVLNDKRTFEAKVVGVDASTDIALLKIDATGLPTMVFGNSDNLRVGEWVLAVGNPFNLTSTVTAGIVSAKARNINILNADMKIESFIQTDAAVNPGNSGGALVNTKGELVGINTAIASRTGSYAGYSFAVPISIVSKVVADIKEFGVVQRAVLGVQIRDIDAAFAKKENLETLAGAYVAEVQENSAAAEAGIKKGDILTAINNVKVKTVSQLQEQVGRYRPGDKINVTLERGNKSQTVTVELKNRSGNTNVVKAGDLTQLGATFKEVNDVTRSRFRLAAGIEVESVERGGKFDKAGIEKGFIILKVNGAVIRSEQDLESVVNDALNADNDDRVLFVTGAYPNGKMAHYAVALE